MDTAAIRPGVLGVSLALVIVPRSGKDEVVGLVGEAIKIKLRAAPVDGRANDALLDYLARRLDVARTHVRIVSGAAGRRKIVQIDGVTADRAARLLLGCE